MDTHVNFDSIVHLFEKSWEDNRSFLFEYEVYDLIRYIGSETPPAYQVVRKKERITPEKLDALPGDKVVLKILSPYILHKSDVDGVQIVEKKIESVLSCMRRMYYDIPVLFRQQIDRGVLQLPEGLAGLSDEDLEKAVTDSIDGVVLCQYMHPDSQEFGNELLVSLRCTREFGMILSAGLGGTDTELYAQRFRKGQAVVAASTAMVDGQKFFSLFQETISYRKLAGLTRGQKRIVTDEQLLECFTALIEVGNHFSPANQEAPFIIEELEINPFAFSNYLMMPLDGLCRFGQPFSVVKRDLQKRVGKLLHPESIGIVGASSKGKNIGRIILENILKVGFPQQKMTVIHPGVRQIDGINTVPDLHSIPKKVDMLVLAVNGDVVPGMVELVIDKELAESVILIPGGYGPDEKRERALVNLAEDLGYRRENGEQTPVFLGGNSLGVLSLPGGYDALFIPETKLPKKQGDYVRNSALVSQSGAYMITRMSKLSFLDPAYGISIGNQIDLTAADFLDYLKGNRDLTTIAFYMEGFCDLDGLRFAKAVEEAIPSGKEVVFYKAGRTPEGKTALSGHTASIAGDYMVCESCIGQAGAFVAETFSEFEGLLRLSQSLYHKNISGSNLAAISNAGFESVGIADNIIGEGYSLSLARWSEPTHQRLENLVDGSPLQSLVSLVNPMDITPMADEDFYGSVIECLLQDVNVDMIIVAIVPLTPLLHTLPDEIIEEDKATSGQGLVSKITTLNNSSFKPLIIVVDSGSLYDPLANNLEDNGLPVFRSADQAVRVLGKYVQKRLAVSQKRRPKGE